MKKRILGLVLVMILVLASAMPVFADTEGTIAPAAEAKATTTVSEDAQVQAAYDAYCAMVDSMKVNEYGPTKDYYEQYMSITDGFNDKQQAEWDSVVAKNIGVEEALSNLYDASMIVNTVALKEAYQKNPDNAKTAYEFVLAYEACVDAGIAIDKMDAGIESVYETAKETDLPSENAMAVYEAYVDVAKALDSEDPAELSAAIKSFEKVVETYNNLTKNEFNDIAELLEIQSDDPEMSDGEYAAEIIFADWMDINILDSINKVYSEYLDNPNAENVAALVEVYDLVFPENEDDEVISKELVYAFFPDLDDVYAEALTLLDENGEAGTTDKDKDTATENKEGSTPQTGDDFNMQLPLAAMILSAGVAALALKRKRVQ